MEISGHKKAAFAMLAESAGLIGASIRRSPANKETGEDVFAYPDIRQWLSFSPERVYDRSLVLVVGILSAEGEANDNFLRPLVGNSSTTGHLHAAAFSYAPITRGQLNLDETITHVFENETLQGLMHLLPDDRDSSAVLQSEFKRGAVWIGGLE